MKKKMFQIFCLFFLAFWFIFIFTSCQSTDKTQSTMNRSDYTISCTYDSETNKTKIIWGATFENNTIYKIEGFSAVFDLYNGDTFLESSTYNYDFVIANGGSIGQNFIFTYDGEVTTAEFSYWTAQYASFWDTYRIWIIVTIIVAAIASIIYIIVMIVQDLELDDTWDALTDSYLSILFYIAISTIGIGSLTTILTSYWVPVVIILGGIIAFVLICLLGHLVKYIIEEGNFSFGGISFRHNRNRIDKEIDDKEQFNPSMHTVDEYLDDKEILSKFPVSDLKDYCRMNDIKGFSKLNKDALVDLIVNYKVDLDKNSSIKRNIKNSNNKLGKITFDDIAGLDNVKKAFREKVILPFEHPEIFTKFGKKAGGGILLYGLPGTGKTMFAEAASNEINATFISVKCSDIKSKWYGESEQRVKAIFTKARKSQRAIIFFDEFDAIGTKRTENSENINNDLVPEILAEMQGAGTNNSNSTIMVIAATNKPWNIDSAFLRPGRFDEKIYVPLPDEIARKKLFELQLKDLPIAEDFDYDYVTKITEGFNSADIKEVCEKLKLSAIKDSIEKGEEQTIGMDDVKRIEDSIKSSVSLEEIEYFKKFEQTF